MIRLQLTITTGDEAIAELVRAYWSIEPDGTWTHPTVKELATKFGHQTAMVHRLVNRHSIARCDSLRCEGPCGEPWIVHSRSSYLALRADPRRTWVYSNGARLCGACVTNHFEEKRKIADEKASHEQRIIAAWRDAASERRQIKAFVDAPVKDAFLLYGLLDSAGSAWKGSELSSWETYRPRLFAHIDDTQEAYRYLYKNGWIEPSSNAPANAFSVDGAGDVRFEWARVNWTLCPESADGSTVAVLQLLEDAMNDGTSAELAELWRWVCMSELREHFESIRRRHSFQSEGWSGVLEETVERLLEEFSLRQMFGIIWNSCKNFWWQRSDSHYPKRHGHNSLSGNLRQTVDRLRASGRPVDAWWTRPGPEKEARYTGLLFDRLLVGGDEFYKSLTGAKLRDVQRGASGSFYP